MSSSNNLRSYFPNYLSTDSLFTKMSSLGAPWSSEVGQDMDDAYFTMYSGIKNPSEFVLLHLNPDSATANSLTIARILYGIYGENWTKIWEAFKTKYNPIENYNMQETIDRTKTNDRVVGRDKDFTSNVDGTETETGEQDDIQNVTGETGSNSTTDSNGTSSLDHGETVGRTAQSDSFIFAFNSSEKSPTSSQIEEGTDTHSGTDTTTTTDHSENSTTGTSKTDSTGKTTTSRDIVSKDVRVDKEAENITDTDDEKENQQLTRAGNIGVTTTQQMLQQEFELWRWNFFTQVFEDVDKFLTLSVYSSCIH